MKSEQTTATHTPGPWTVRPTRGTQFDFTIADVDDNFKITATNPSESGNARLIASAPFMLDHLNNIFYGLAYDDDTSLDQLVAMIDQARDSAQAAIAKATK